MARLTGIAEIVLWTADLQASLDFYQGLLGLELISPPTLRNRFLKVAEGHAGIPQMIVLVPRPEPEPEPKPAEPMTGARGHQLHHLAFELAPEAFDALRAALVAAGYAPRGGTHPVLPSRTMYVDDPDGNEVEFICQDLASEV